MTVTAADAAYAVAGGDTECEYFTSSGDWPRPNTITAACDAQFSGTPQHRRKSDGSWRFGLGIIAGGDTPCVAICTICGAESDAGADWCDGCDDDYRLAGDDPA